MELKFEIDDETSDAITVENLKVCFEYAHSEYIRLKRMKKDLADYQLQDLRDSKKNSKAIRRVIRYFSSQEEFQEWDAQYEAI